MSLHTQPLDPIPELTSQIAHASFPKGTWPCICEMRWVRTMRMPTLPSSFPNGDERQKRTGDWRWSPSRKRWKNLSGRQAAEMVQGRLDRTYELSLPQG